MTGGRDGIVAAVAMMDAWNRIAAGLGFEPPQGRSGDTGIETERRPGSLPAFVVSFMQ